MTHASKINEPGTNRLLNSLPRKERERLLDKLDRVSFALRQPLFEADEPIPHIHFPLNGVMSLVITLTSGRSVEVGTIGNEGMLGVPLLLATDRSPTRAFCQVAGDTFRIKAAAFLEEVERSPALHQLLQHYVQALINQISQTVACNHVHSIEQRTCRWLLMTHDRVGRDAFYLTQEFLAQMLGVRRASVSVVAGILQQNGLINYNRGQIQIVNRKRLEAASCECYGVVKREFVRLLT